MRRGGLPSEKVVRRLYLVMVFLTSPGEISMSTDGGAMVNYFPACRSKRIHVVWNAVRTGHTVQHKATISCI